MKEDAQFYIGQKAFINKGGKVLVLINQESRLDYPGGKIEEGDPNLVESLKREVREETGLEIAVGEAFATWTGVFHEQHKLAGKRLFLVAYRCEYISGDIKLSDEHITASWVDKDNFTRMDNGTTYFDVLKKYYLK